MGKKLSLILLIAVFLSVIMAGCQDAVEIDEEVYPLVIGVDRGVNNIMRLTVQYPNYKSGGDSGGKSGGAKSGGGSSQEVGEIREVEGTIVATIEASSILGGVNYLNTSISRMISLTHAKMIVFSEDFARLGIGEYLAPMMRYRDTRRIMHVVVCRGKAEDFILENKPAAGVNPSKAIELMVTQSQNSGLFPRVTFVDFNNAVKSPYEQAFSAYSGVNNYNNMEEKDVDGKPELKVAEGFLPGEIPRRGAPKREFVGTAVFRGDKMVGTLDSFETRCMMLIRGEFKRGIITIEDKNKPNNAIPLDVHLGRKPKVTAHFDKGVPVVDLKMNIEADIGGIQSRIDYEKMSKLTELEFQFKDFITSGITRTVEKTQKDLKSDIFGFGHKVSHNFKTIEEWDRYDWLKHYPEAKINIDVEVNIRRTGLMIHSEPIRGDF